MPTVERTTPTRRRTMPTVELTTPTPTPTPDPTPTHDLFLCCNHCSQPFIRSKDIRVCPPYIWEINWSILCFTFFLYICLMNVVLEGEGSQYYLLCGWSHVCFSLITAIIITTRLLCRFLNVLGWKRRIGLFLCYFIII